MSAINGIIEKLKTLPERLNEIVIETVQNNEAVILDMNTEEQLFEQGITSKGVSISDYAPYSPITIELKKEKGQPTSRVTLRDEGDFQQSFFIEYTQDGFEIKASDWKTGNLVIYYGEEIMGLTDENLSELIKQYIYPELIKLMREL